MTYSIIAIDRDAGLIGTATQTHWLAVGSIVSFVEAGVGAIASQAMADPFYGRLGMPMLRDGHAPDEVLASLREDDDAEHTRQVGIVDVSGRVAAFTGDDCIREASHAIAGTTVALANIMEVPGIPEAMVQAFAASSGPLHRRLLGALRAAQAMGGDLRGQQSAVLRTTSLEPLTRGAFDPSADLRVDDHPAPLDELERLVGLYEAYRSLDLMEAGVEGPEVLDAVRASYEESGREEIGFWLTRLLEAEGHHHEAERTLAALDPRWRELKDRLPTRPH